MKNYNKNNPTTPADSFEEFCQRGNITKKMLKERWKSLPFSNDFIFCKVMEDNPMLCKKALQLLTGLPLVSALNFLSYEIISYTELDF